MYGTSRLIIPPKPARNSPYIPKLRIKLRPSTGRNRLNRENDRSETLLANRTPRFLGRSTTRYMNGCSSDSPNISQPDPNATNIARNSKVIEKDSNLGKRTTRKRKSTPSVENIDLDHPESILTTISLKTVINRDSFYSLPVDTQRMLVTLLPLCDHEVQTWMSCFETPYTATKAADNKEQQDLADASSSVESSSLDANNRASKAVWLHPSSLNNEFFTKALQDYANSQARGEFAASRVRHRSGLRPSVRGQSRYTSPSLRSSQDQSHAVLEEGSDDQSLTRTTPSPKRFRQRSSAFRSNTPKNSSSSAKANRAPPKDSLSGSPSLAPSGPLARLQRRLNNRVCRPLRRAKQLTRPVVSPTESIPATECTTTTTTVPPSPTTPKIQTTISFPSAASHHHGERTSLPVHHSTEELPDAGSTSSAKLSTVLDANDWQKMSSHCGSPEPGSSEKQSPSRQKRLSNSHFIGGGVDCAKSSPPALSTATTSTTSASTVRPSLLTSSRLATTHHSLQPGSVLTTESTDATPPQMPPPRQTKTLASMREKLRAKRLLKETERGQTPNGRQNFFHALPGSMTPHPASGGNGYFNAPTGYLSLTTSPLKSSSSGILASPTHHGAGASLSLFNGTSDDVACSGRVSMSSVYSGGGSSGQSSPRSLPALGTSTCPVSAEVQSLVSGTVAGQVGSHFDGFDSATFLPSYPSSPHSTGLCSGAQTSGATAHRLSFPASSPQPIRSLHPTSTGTGCYGLLPRQEHSVSAPPTPLSPQAGHTLLAAVMGGDKPGVAFVGESSSSVHREQSTMSPAPQSGLSLQIHPIPGSGQIAQSNAGQLTPVSNYGQFYTNSASGDVAASPSTTMFPGKNPPLRMSQSNPQLAAAASPSSTASGNSTLISPSVNTVAIQKIDKIHSLAEFSSSTDSSPTTSMQSEAISKLLTSVVTATMTSVAGSSSTSNGNGSSNNSSMSGVTPAKPNATTRAYFVDGDNLPEAVAIIQNRNPGATITQQQFLLIPSPNKSQLFLCRAPVTKASEPPTTSSLNGVSPIAAKTDMTVSTDTAAPIVVAACPRSLLPTTSVADETLPAESNALVAAKTVSHPAVTIDRSSKPPTGAPVRTSQSVKRTASQPRVSSSPKPIASVSIQPNHSGLAHQFARLKPSTKGIADQPSPVIASGTSHAGLSITNAKQTQSNTTYSSVVSPCAQATATLLPGSIASDFLIPSQTQVNTVISSPALLCSINPPMTCQYQTLPYGQNPPTTSGILATGQAVTSTATLPVASYFFDASLANSVNSFEHHAPIQLLHPSASNTTILFNGGSPKTGVHLATPSATAAVAISPSLYCPVSNMTTTASVIMAPHVLHSAQAMLANNNISTVCSPRLVVAPSSLPSNYLLHHHHHHNQQQQ